MTRIALYIRSAVLAAAAAVACGPCRAALAWSGTAAEIEAVPGQEKAVAEFAFRNVGAGVVRVVSLQPSCDCTTAKASKESFASGEAGMVRVEFTLGSRRGRQVKTVTVTTDEPNEKPVELLLVVDIPEDVSIRPRALFWAVGSKPEEKSAEVVVLDASAAKLEGVQCPDERFQAKVEPGGKPGVFRVVVRPVDTAAPVQTTLRVTAIIAGHPQVYVLYAAVK